MRSNRGLVVTLCVVGMLAEGAVASSCGGNGNAASGGGGFTGTSTHASMGGSSGTQGGGGTQFTTGPGAGGGMSCSSKADCKGGVCNNGMCCPSEKDVCGSQCCTGATVCLSAACVTPGKDCYSAADCGKDHYCETALGDDSDAGVPEAGTSDGGVCTEPLPRQGKCLPSPVVCAGDAGTGGDAGCVADCEYHPPLNLMLNAAPKWQWGPTAVTNPDYTDVWSTPTVGRVYDTNCDGKIDELDSPVVIFVSGNDLLGVPAGTNCQGVAISGTTMCKAGTLRMLDGKTGQEIWSLDKAVPNSAGFAGMSVAIADIDGDGRMDIIATTGEGYIVMIDSNGNTVRKSDAPLPGVSSATFGWGGGISIADMDGDGFPEIAVGATVFTTTNNAITLKWTGAFGPGGGSLGMDEALSTFVDLDGAPDNNLELLTGNAAYKTDGTVLWHNAAVPDGFPGVGDFNGDGKPDVVVVANGMLYILDGATGVLELPAVALPGTGSGGPPTVANFDGLGQPEIGVAMATFYSVLKPDYANNKIDVVWSMPNHDLSSSVTGSTVFDFEGAGHPSVIYADECFLWVFDGATGAVRYATSHTSFTGTEASLVADVDGDGHAEILMITNGADPSSAGWACMDASGTPATINGVTWVPSTLPNKSYRGIVSIGDTSNSWVGTRTLWNEHTYHVSNICDDTDSACPSPNVYGSVPKVETKNWSLPWLNNFRQNVQDKGIFNAPDAVVALTVDCSMPVKGHASVRNIGLASLPAGVTVGLFVRSGGMDTQVGQGTTTQVLFPGQTQLIDITANPSMSSSSDSFVAKILVDPMMPLFHECNTNNDDSDVVKPHCVM